MKKLPCLLIYVFIVALPLGAAELKNPPAGKNPLAVKKEINVAKKDPVIKKAIAVKREPAVKKEVAAVKKEIVVQKKPEVQKESAAKKEPVVGNPFERAKEKLGTIIAVNGEFVGTKNREDFEPYLETQTPNATVVMCSDSRVQPTALHDNPKGHLFTIRNIGNQIDSNEGSVDFGVLVLKTPLLLVLGHTGCGAVIAVMKGYSDVPESIQDELDTIDIGGATGEKEALLNNIDTQIEGALEKYKELIKKKELFVVGAIYDLHNIFGYGYGALVFTNVNGDISAKGIKSNVLFDGVKDLKVVR